MKEIVKIQDHKGIPTVSARELHEYLEVGKDFSTWIKDRIEKYDFLENSDYLLTKIGEQMPSGMKYKIEYYLNLNMAKEIAMLENNNQGKLVRKYFIMVEEAYRKGETGKKQIREKSKQARNFFTEALKDHGYDKKHYFIQTTRQMKKELGVEGKKDEMSKTALKKIMAAELLSEIKLDQSDAFGYYEVNPICIDSCKAVITATEVKRQIA